MGEGGINKHGFSGYLVLLGRRHRPQCAHVVQAVGYLDQNNTDIVRHGKQQFPEILGLSRNIFTKHATRYFCQPVYNLSYFLTKENFYIFYCIFGIFYHVVQQCRTDGCGTQPYLAANDACDGYRVHDIWLSRTATGSFVSLLCQKESFGNNFYLAPVVRLKIIIDQTVKFRLDG